MNHNPKVVPIQRSAAYVHHRALKNMRDNNPVDALELMRQAVEQSPDNREYQLDLAEMYCEMGCHEQSNRILLDLLTQEGAPAECYYGLALNQFGRNEMESARQALLLYQRSSRNGEYMEEAGGLREEMDYYDSLRRPLNRKKGRAERIAERACDALKQDDPEGARRLFERSFALNPRQPEARALYAMTLHLLNRREEALRQAHKSVEEPDAGMRALCVSAQVFYQCGLKAEAGELLARAIARKSTGAELRLLIFALGEAEMHAEAAEAVKRALWETPHDKALLHMRAVALQRAGRGRDQAKGFWLRILRLDPEDSIARFYYDAACSGKLGDLELPYNYQVPAGEYRRRLVLLADCLSEGLDVARERWTNDDDFRRLVLWALDTGDESSGRAAAMVIASAEDARARSALRAMLYRGDISPEVKLHALVFLRLQGGDAKAIMPRELDVQSGVLPQPEEILKDMPACERQLVRFAGEVLEAYYGVRVHAMLAVLWQTYRQACAQDNDPLVCTQEAAAALAWNYLLDRNCRVSADRLAQQFGCNRRRMIFYARRMAAVLETQGGNPKDEDH